MGDIKLQLLCSVRIELAVGSLHYPGMIRIPRSVLDETGNYLDSQFVSLSGREAKSLWGYPLSFPWKASTPKTKTKEEE